MIRNFLSILALLLSFAQIKVQAQTVVINTGVAGTPAYNAGPIYRSSTSSAYDASRYAYLYTQAELAAAGITTGSIITNLGWVKNNTAISNGGGIFRIYMKNSAAATYGSATETWSNLNTGALLVYENLSFVVPATASPNYITFLLNTSFTYTGGSLEISVEWDINQVSGTASTGTFDWLWSTVPNRIYGTGQTTLAGAGTLSSTSNSISDITGRRPFLQITYTPAGPCTNPPTPGTAATNITGPICPDTPVNLSLSGNSTGTGMTYEWESAATSAFTTPVSISTPAAVSTLSITSGTSSWYRAKLVCSNSTPVYSTPVQLIVSAPLPGNTYTINNSLPTGGLNYNSFADAINAMQCGIAGPVTFNVTPGTPYVETISIGNITGASATNKIRFNGNGALVQFDNTTTNRQLLTLDGAKFVTIDSLTFKTLNATFGWGARIAGAATRDSITRCFFDLTSVTSTTAANVNGILFTGSATATTTAGVNGTHCYIAGNHLKGSGAAGGLNYGVGIASGGSDSNIIRNNIIENYYNSGIYISTAKGTLIENNLIHKSDKTAGIVGSEGISTVSGDMSGSSITGNRIYAPGGVSGGTGVFRALSLLGDGTATNPVIVANNVIYKMNLGGASSGIYASAALYNKIYHNTITLDQVLTGTAINYGLHIIGTNTGTEIKNNNISITEGTGGIKYGFYYAAAASVDDAQRNNFYVSSNQSGVQHYGYYTTDYATQAAFQTAYPALEQGSLTANPQFTNAATGDLLPTNNLLSSNGVNLQSQVPADIYGNPRSSLPTPGAYEMVTLQGPDAGLVSLISPTVPFCKGQQPIRVSVVNSGTTQLSSFQVHWQLNNVQQSPFTFSGLLDTANGAGQYVDTVTIGTVDLPAGNNTIKAWIVLATDINDVNDTMEVSVTPTVFTINAPVNSICNGGNISLNLSPSTGYATGMLQWQSSANNTAFNPIPLANNISYTGSGLTANQYYRVFINSGVNGCYSDTFALTVLTPLVTTVNNGANCGPGTVQLSAVPSAGAGITWYDVPSGGTAVATGNLFTTPALSASSTYYVSAGNGAAEALASPTIGTAEFYTATAGWGLRFTATQAATIDSVTIKARHSTAPGAATMQIRVTDLTDVVLYSGVVHNFTVTATATEYRIPVGITVPPGNYKMVMTATGINQLVRESSGVTFPYSSPSNAISITAGANGAGTAQTTSAYYWFYNWKITTGCESPRVPVQAVIHEIPVVDLGADVVSCTDGTATQTLNAGNPGSTYSWNNTATSQTITVNSSGSYSVTVTRNACSSSDQVNVTFNNNPTVNLGADTGICDGVVLLLNAGNPGAVYSWDNASAAQTRNASAAGLYYVTVTDGNNCSGSDSLNLIIHQAPLVNIGNDTAICDGDVITLNTGNPGLPTLWNNGATSQTIDVGEAGTYAVSVSAFGCETRDTINISILPDPVADAINATYSDSATYTFYPLNATHATGYTWDFGDGTPTETGFQIQHTYAANGIYTVTLTLQGTCINVQAKVSRTVDVFDGSGSTRVNDLKVQEQVNLYPNPAQHQVVIEGKDGIVLQQIDIYNIAGQSVFSKEAGSARLTVNVEDWTPGTYLVKIKTAKGWKVRKMEIIR